MSDTYRERPHKNVDIGSKFGKWTVLAFVRSYYPERDYYDYAVWKCQCECGTVEELTSGTLNDMARRKYHDGCWKCESKYKDVYEKIKNDENYRHSYRVWFNMCSRCNKKENRQYKNYGGRGITVCNEWKDSFKAFYFYVSTLEHYGELGRSLDRIDNDKGYFPGNVRWATAKEQANNQRHRKKKG